VDWAKVDAPLAAALAGASADDALPVFVHVDRSAADVNALDALNLGDVGDVGTALVSPAQVDALTERDWVLSVRLSGHLNLLAEPPPSASAPAGDHDAGGGHHQGPAQQDEGKHRPT
jgi:hypothetical protein